MAAKRKRGTVLVATRPIPRFRVLSDVERVAERNMNALLRRTISEVRQTVLDAPLDPGERALLDAAEMARSLGVPEERILSLAGADLGAEAEAFEILAKSPGAPGLFDPLDQEIKLEEKRGLALIAHEVRGRHGAPTSPAGWLADRDAEVIDRILAAVPFRMGRLVPNRAGARRLPPRHRQGREPSRRPVALVDEFRFDANSTSREMRRILELGRGAEAPVPEVVRHPLAEGMDPVYTVISHPEVVQLALWAGLPALEMDIWEPAEAPAAPPTMLPAIDDLEELNRVMAEKFGPHQYKVPPALEPVAELAREIPRRIFVDAFSGRPSEEEVDARQETDLLNAARTKIWVSLFRAARASGVGPEAARQRAEKSPEWRRASRSWRIRERKARRLEAEGHERRERLRLAKAVSLNFARELSLPLSAPGVRDDFSLWMEARHGRIDLDELEQEVLMHDPEESPVPRSRRIPSHLSDKRHPNLRSVDGAPNVFRFEFDDYPPPEHPPPVVEHTVVPGDYMPDHVLADQPSRERTGGDLIPVVEMTPTRADGGEGPGPAAVSAADPALVVAVAERG